MAIKAVMTNAGTAMITQCITSGIINVSKAEVGSDAYTSEDDIKEATALCSKLDATVSISNTSYTGSAAQISVQLSTDGTTEMTIKEIGVYISDSVSSTGVLACYAYYTDDDCDKISKGALFDRIYDIVIAVSGGAELKVTSTLSGYQTAITAAGILVGDGQGNVTAATGVESYTTEGTTYAKGSHTHKLTDASITDVLPVAKGGTNATTVPGAQAELGITPVIYSATQPGTVTNGTIWLQPVS